MNFVGYDYRKEKGNPVEEIEDSDNEGSVDSPQEY